MKNVKVMSIFKINENIPFMKYVVNDMEENENGIKLTLENGESICIKDYGHYFLSEAESDLDSERMANCYRMLVSELSRMSEEKIKSLIPKLNISLSCRVVFNFRNLMTIISSKSNHKSVSIAPA